MADRRAQTERIQRANPAHSQQDFLPDAGTSISTVKTVGQVAIFFVGIVGNIRVEQEQRHAPNLHLPDHGFEFAPR
jgi:hypothetical protein